MRTYPKTFDTSMVHLVEAGESTGNLIPVLENLISHLEERSELRKKIMGGLSYPIFICCLAFGVVLLFLYVLLPNIRKMMDGMGGQMSFSTQLLIGMSQSAVTYGPWILVLVVIIVVSVMQWRNTPKGRSRTDTWVLRIPLLKYIFINTDICRVSNLCATLLESGVNTTETLRMTERSIQNTVVQSRFSAARMLINDGASFSNAFKHYHVLPDLDLDLLSVGENTGNIAKSFREIYRNHSRELSEQFSLLTVLITTGALGCAFILVAILALGIVSAVLGMSKSLAGHH
jgi:type II secretory pathway component PulF